MVAPGCTPASGATTTGGFLRIKPNLLTMNDHHLITWESNDVVTPLEFDRTCEQVDPEGEKTPPLTLSS